eukprot:6202736-Pleurochrysis_carterae.AAC.1
MSTIDPFQRYLMLVISASRSKQAKQVRASGRAHRSEWSTRSRPSEARFGRGDAVPKRSAAAARREEQRGTAAGKAAG